VLADSLEIPDVPPDHPVYSQVSGIPGTSVLLADVQMADQNQQPQAAMQWLDENATSG
jgi:hypothetical protein